MPVQSKTFRVFVSSTFSDMREERRILLKDVFPRLEKYCEQHGAQFQAIDLRWGVNEESQLDQKTMDICLSEIRRCQKMSPKPNFIMLLGDRYGWQPLPARIEAAEFDSIVQSVEPDLATILGKWYWRDDNSLPPEYVLQPRNDVLREYKAWEPIERQLRETLRAVAIKAGLSDEQKVKYFASATHQEIMLGALNPPQEVADAREHVFACLRKIDGLPQDETAGQYVDLVAGKVDGYSRVRLKKLRKELGDTLGDEHCLKYHATWKDGAAVLADAKAFSDRVYDHLFAVIDAQIREFVSPGEVEHERLLQKEFRERLVEHFRGRGDALAAISGYLDKPNGKVLALVGASGSGKSSVMAKAITEAKQRKGFHVYRFLGTTSRTSDVMDLLQSLCAEITGCYGTTLEDLFCKDVKEETKSERLKALHTENGLRELFNSSLTLATPDKPTMLFLDALDQLTGAEELGALSWLPRELPENVALVVSCLPYLASQLPEATPCPLDQMPAEEAGVILDAWLAARGCRRTLRPEQRDAILAGFAHKGLPIYLRLAFEAARKWHSYDKAPALPHDVSGMLVQFFSELERQHTPITVAKAIGYMLSGRYSGLTEEEILDMLVFDEEHWQAFLARTHKDHLQEVLEANTLPVVIWSRLFLDLEPYLTERNMHGVRIITFFHRQFIKFARERYCGNIGEHNNFSQGNTTNLPAPMLHKNLARYFVDLILFVDGDKREMPNVRKCVEQPWQQTRGEMWSEVAKTLGEIFFVEARAKAGMLDLLQMDFEEALQGMREGEEQRWVNDFYTLFMRQKHILVKYPNLIFQQLYNELQWKKGRLRVRAEKARDVFLKAGGRFLHQYREPKTEISHLLMTLSGHSHSVYSCAYAPDGLQIVSGGGDNTLKIWDAKTGNKITTLSRHSKSVISCAYAPDGLRIVSGSEDKTLKIWDAKTGKELKTINGHSRSVSSCAYSPDGLRIVSGSYDKTLKIWDAKTGKELTTLTGHNETVNSCAYSPDGLWIVSGSEDKTLKIWDAETGKEFTTLSGHSDSVYSCAYSPDGSRIVSGSWDKTLKIWDAMTGQEITTLTGYSDRVNSCAYSPDGLRIVSGSSDNTLKISDAKTGKEIMTLSGHSLFVYSCTYSPDGLRIVSGSWDKTLKIWDAKTGKGLTTLIGHNEAVNSCAYSPDGSSVLSGSKDKTLKIWDTETGKELTTLSGHSDSVYSCAYSPDGSSLVSGSWDKTLKIWDAKMGKEVASLSGHYLGVYSCAYSPDGLQIVSGSSDNTLKIWDAKKSKEIMTLTGHSESIDSCAYSPDGLWIVSGSYDKTLIIWDAKTGKELMTLTGHDKGVTSCSYSPDGLRIVSGSWNNTLKIWDTKTGKEITTLSGHSDPVVSCAYSPDGLRIVSGSWDKTVKLWDARTGCEQAAFVCEANVKAVAFSPCGSKIAIGDNAGNLYLFALKGFTIGRPLLTGVQFLLDDETGVTGTLAPDHTAVCPFCGDHFPLSDSLRDAIASIKRNCQTGPDNSPCIKLPAEAWDHSHLLSECPKCYQPLRFNPFVVDSKRR